LERQHYYHGNSSGGDSMFEPLMDISHKPIFLGNVFGKADAKVP
jgi:hypothetical protein